MVPKTVFFPELLSSIKKTIVFHTLEKQTIKHKYSYRKVALEATMV